MNNQARAVDRKKKILIADDDPAILEALTMMLEDEGYKAETTANGETMGKIEAFMPDLIMLDIWMSGQDGRDICMLSKKQEKTKHIPIVMISANKDAKDISLACGADDFIAKPFEIEELLDKVKKYVG